MGNYRETFTIARGNEINGLSRTAYEVADKYQTDCELVTTLKGGTFLFLCTGVRF